MPPPETETGALTPFGPAIRRPRGPQKGTPANGLSAGGRSIDLAGDGVAGHDVRDQA